MIASLAAGNLINCLLHGILTVQFYLYCLAFPNDKTYLKTIIYTVYFLATVQVISLGIIILVVLDNNSLVNSTGALPFYSYTPWWGNPFRASIWQVQGSIIDLIGGLVPLIAQCLYAYRIRIITQTRVMPYLIATIATFQLVVAIICEFWMDPIVLLFWIGLNVVNDFFIACAMVRSLSKEKLLSDQTKSKVARLVLLIVVTGSLTVAANLVCIVLFWISQTASPSYGWVGLAILIFMPNLYANSILLMLNNRMTIRKSRDAQINMTSTNVASALVIAFNPIRPSDSAASYEEVPSVSSPA